MRWFPMMLAALLVTHAQAGCPLADAPVLEQSQKVYLQAYAGGLMLCDGDKNLRWPLTNADASHAAIQVDQHWHFPNRQSFVVVSGALGEVWEISYNPRAPEIATGKVHDFQYREGAFVPGYLHPQRGRIPQAVITASQAQADEHGLWLEQDGKRRFYHLDVRKFIPRPAS